MLGRKRLSVPRAHDGVREAIRVHAVTRAGAVRVRTGAINELKAIIVTADEALRAELRGLRTSGQVAACATFHDRPRSAIHEQATRSAMRSLAQRVQLLDAEVAAHDRALRELIDQAAPQLIAERGIGYITAAQFYVAWSHPGRCHSEAAFARLGGTSPVPATSGQNQTRHRLNRGGDRQLNRALYLVAITKQRCDPATRAYIARRVAEGKTEREAIRCIKRFLARRVWRLLEHPDNNDSSGRVGDRTVNARWAGVKGGRRPAVRTLDAGPVDRVASIMGRAPAPGRGPSCSCQTAELGPPTKARRDPKSVDRHRSITISGHLQAWHSVSRIGRGRRSRAARSPKAAGHACATQLMCWRPAESAQRRSRGFPAAASTQRASESGRGVIPLTVEAKRLINLLHQARAGWFHHRTGLNRRCVTAWT
jgi:transposase